MSFAAIAAADMPGYLFYPPADAAQDRIWRDTVERWDESQAVRYIEGLHKHLQKLSETRALWRRLPQRLIASTGIKEQAYFSHYERHYLFFRELPSGKIGVMSILHERMDLPVRLSEDLVKLAGDPK
jgi:plasmid stabilization system protein ParE